MPVVPECIRNKVALRARGICEYCRYPEEFNFGRFTIDHILPRSKGGSDHIRNLALACRSCNENKGAIIDAIDPATGRAVELYNLRVALWENHFCWSNDFTLMVGLTSIGKATILALRTNHPGVVKQFKILYKLGLHPSDP